MEELQMSLTNLWILGGVIETPVVPEPTSVLIWGGIIVFGGIIYWWRRKR
jgi:hypothetical protein